MRVLVIILLISFSIFAKYLLEKQIVATNKLTLYKNNLESIVNIRTQELKDEIEIRKKAEIALEKAATTDPLTSLFNRRKFNEIIKHEIEREHRYKGGLFLILCDIDKFKDINDKYGHNTGDEVLKTFSKTIKTIIRKSDVVARWGGEEFIFLISNSDIGSAQDIADKLRKLVQDTDFKVVDSVTASFGVSFFKESDDEVSLIDRADKALYQAKKNGRNRVEFIT